MFYKTLLPTLSVLTVLAAQVPAPAQWTEVGKLAGSDTSEGDNFGFSVAMSGNTAVFGAFGDDDAGDETGSAYLFDMTTGRELFKLTADDGAAYDNFGNAVAISGSTAIVGGRYDDDAGEKSGSAYLFDTTTGNQLHKLTATNAMANDRFGRSAGICGNTAIVGAPWRADKSGSAYLFDVTTGNQLFELIAPNTAEGNQFGFSVAVSDNTAIVGARLEDGVGDASGSVHLFDTTTGKHLQELIGFDTAEYDNFGTSVAVSGNTVIVGAPADDDSGRASGSAYLFDLATGNQLHKLTASDGKEYDGFGWSVGISGNIAIVGSYHSLYGAPPGKAYLFDVTTGKEILKLTPHDGTPNDRFGYSVDVSGNVAIVASPLDDGNGYNSGAVYAFAVPEPSTLALLAMGAFGLLACWRRRTTR